MSHTSTLKTIHIRNKEAIKDAVAFLKRKGLDIDLMENTSPRMYYANQVGACDYILRLNNAKYDVGLKLNKNTMEYEILLDTYGDHVKNVLGVSGSKVTNDAPESLIAVEQFVNAYGIMAARDTILQDNPGALWDIEETKDGGLELMVTVG